MDYYNNRNLLDDFSYNKTLLFLILAGVSLSVLPAIIFSILESYLRSFTGEEFSLTNVIEFTFFFGLFAIPFSIMLYIVFKRTLKSLFLPTKEQILENMIKYRRLFQIIYIPFTFITGFTFIVLYYILLSPFEENWFITLIAQIIYLPGLFCILAFIVMEYIIDQTLSPKVTLLLEGEEVKIFNTFSTAQKNLLIEILILSGLYAYLVNLIIISYSDNVDYADKNYINIIIITLIFILVLSCVILNYITTKSKVKDLNAHMADVLTGKSQKAELALSSIDDIGNLVQMHNSITLRMKSNVNAIKNISTNVAEEADELASIVEETNTLSEKITSSVQQINSGASLQSDTTASAMRDILKMSIAVDEAVKDIEKTLIFIQDIATQTNMLALNAAIEAARAGEYGRGFVVVADNVRRLAIDTKESANNVNILINEIVTNIGGSISGVQESLQGFATQSIQFVNSSDEVVSEMAKQANTIERLTETAKKLSELADEIKISL